jgi:ubiquitin carboxyl-terminal hydrolase 8
MVLHKDIYCTKKKDHKYAIYEELKEIFAELWLKNHSLIPAKFMKAFYESLGDLYTPGEQFDFTEMWMVLLNNLLEETHTPTFVSTIYSIHPFTTPLLKYLQEKSIETCSQFFKNTNSPLNDILHGIQIQQIECKQCKKIYHNLEPMSFHYLEICGPSLEHGFQKLLSPEPVDGWKCDHCGHTVGEKVIRFWKLPRIWVLILKRFNQQEKIHLPVDIGLEIRMGKGIEFFSMENPDSSIHYKLKGIANHYGSLHGGHYTAICKNEKEEWCLYDDLQIHTIQNIEEVLHQNTTCYALFYERM